MTMDDLVFMQIPISEGEESLYKRDDGKELLVRFEQGNKDGKPFLVMYKNAAYEYMDEATIKKRFVNEKWKLVHCWAIN